MKERVVATRRNTYYGAATSFIHQHRGIARLDRRLSIAGTATLLAIGVFALWLAALPTIGIIWGYVLIAIRDVLQLSAEVIMMRDSVGILNLRIPILDLQALHPSPLQTNLSALICLLIIGGTFALEERYTPVSYLVRAMCFVQLIACAYFTLWPNAFPHTSGDFLLGMTLISVFITSAVPLVMGGAYYVFDFGFPKKILITAMMMGYMAVLIPFKYATMSIILWKGSTLYLSILYIFFGVPLDVFALIALYAWGMSWRSRSRVDSTTPLHNPEENALRAHKVHRDPVRHARNRKATIRSRTRT